MDAVRLDQRAARESDVAQLAAWNQQLIEDEGQRIRLTTSELEARMQGFLFGPADRYSATLFTAEGRDVGYALWRDETDRIFLRQLFVEREQRRRGIGRAALDLLRTRLWRADRAVIAEVLVHNEPARAFWAALGFVDYAVTVEWVAGRWSRQERQGRARRSGADRA